MPVLAFLHSIHNPLTAVFEVKTGEGISATQEGTSNASGNAVVIGCGFDGDLAISGLWHGVSLGRRGDERRSKNTRVFVG